MFFCGFVTCVLENEPALQVPVFDRDDECVLECFQGCIIGINMHSLALVYLQGSMYLESNREKGFTHSYCPNVM